MCFPVHVDDTVPDLGQLGHLRNPRQLNLLVCVFLRQSHLAQQEQRRIVRCVGMLPRPGIAKKVAATTNKISKCNVAASANAWAKA